jgi:hypothetical protein
VRLSSVPDVGGKAKVETFLQAASAQLGIKAFHVWAADELEAILDKASEIRRSYTAWLTPSDVLSDLVQQLSRPNLSRLLPLALARDLRNERDIRLRDAGQETERPIYIDSVFVDLPVRAAEEVTSTSSGELRGNEADEDDVENKGEDKDAREIERYANLHVTGLLQMRAADKLDPDTCKVQRPNGPRSNRIVLLGGPGQGKSTIGQFICQIARARLLLAASSLSPESEELLKPILQRANTEGIPVVGPCRFPVRVDLPTFADALEKSRKSAQSLTLLSHVATRLSRELDCSIDVNDLRAWLRTCPWLVVLDGLDEVPASGNRDAVVKAIDAFWDEVHLENADVMVIVTSRPQGYQQTLSRRHWEHWELAPLSVKQASRVTTRLAKIRLSDPERREAVLAELQRSFSDPSTRLLSSTPLQATILFGIALLKGAIPHAKWDLFERYYTLLRDRESQKQGADAALFRDFKRQIDVIHYEAGFILQVAAESAGVATSFLTTEQLTALITKVLTIDEFDEAKVSTVVADLRRIATERLVLLTQRIEGRISFEVRSLQEFMAAGQITSASLVSIPERLRSIALSAHWRNVYRIAVSKIFSSAELAFPRADVVGICHALDNGDLGEESRCVCAGARLAVDLLADGVADSAPRFKKSLLRRSFFALDIGAYEVVERLASFLNSDTLAIFDEEIDSRLKAHFAPDANIVYALLGQLLRSHPEWAGAKLLQYWPGKAEEAIDMVEQLGVLQFGASIGERIRSLQEDVSPTRVSVLQRTLLLRNRRHVSAPLDADILVGQLPEWMLLPSGYVRPLVKDVNTLITCFTERVEANCTAWFVSIGQNIERFILRRENCQNGWAVVESAAKFVKDPSKETLAGIADSLRHLKEDDDIRGLVFPWPVQSIIGDFNEGCPISTLVAETRAGRFGDLGDWRQAEQRWRASGLLAEDFLQWNEGRYLNPRIAEIGAPAIIDIEWEMDRREKEEARGYDIAFELVQRISSPRKRRHLISALLTGLSNVSNQVLRKSVVDYLVNQISNYPRSTNLISQLMRASEAWTNEVFLQSLEHSIDRISIGPPRVIETARVDLTCRWRKLIPLFVNDCLRQAYIDSDSPESLDKLYIVPDDQDAEEVRDAITLIDFARGGIRPSECSRLADAIARAKVNPYLVHKALEKLATSEERIAILLQAVKVIRLKHKRLARWRRYVESLQSELEAEPSPLTSASELARLGLPSL